MDTDKSIYLEYPGRPTVQKNNLNIRYRMTKGRKIPFIGHSAEMSSLRDKMAVEFYNQYKKQGFSDPIDYLFEIDMVFYVPRKSEPDLDNLPAIVLDALQGVKIKKTKSKLAITLKDDKLLRRERSHKIVEGDPNYDGQPRTEITIRRYYLSDGDRSAAATPPSGDYSSDEGTP